MTTTLRRSDHGLEAPRDEPWHWRGEGACRHTPDSHIIFAGGRAAHVQAAKARHICRWHCRVLEPCRADAEQANPERMDGLVQAGVWWQRGLPVRPQPEDPGCGRHCDHLRRTT